MVSRHERLYRYVGPEAVRSRSVSAPGGRPIFSREDLRAWLDGQDRPGAVGQVAATFVIDPEGVLRLADRRSEHVACAGGGPVLSAGEMFFSAAKDGFVVEEVSNLSTGFCPEPESWPAVSEALDRIGIAHPGRFTTEVVFRRCPRCGERNVVKDGWFVCQVCGGGLPDSWNFDRQRRHGRSDAVMHMRRQVMANFNIRHVNPDDHAEWLRMRCALWEDCPEEQQVREMEENRSSGVDEIFVAERPDGGLCGFLEAAIRSRANGCDSTPVGYIEGWYVDEDVRQQGVGRALVEAAEEWARSRGCRQMASDAELRNHVSHQAHGAIGYEETARLVLFKKDLV